MEDMMNNKFKKLAENRVNNAIKYIRLVGNLSNKSNYQYTDEQVKRIFQELNTEVDSALQKFKAEKVSGKRVFEL